MADFSTRTEIHTRKVWFLKTPTNWTEVGKVISDISQTLRDTPNLTHLLDFDDTVKVETDDEEIRFVVDLGTVTR